MSDEGFWCTPCMACGARPGEPCDDDCGGVK